jgi:hypothetical protein
MNPRKLSWIKEEPKYMIRRLLEVPGLGYLVRVEKELEQPRKISKALIKTKKAIGSRIQDATGFWYNEFSEKDMLHLDEILATFKEDHIEPITARDFAYIFNQIGIANPASITGSIINEGIIYLPNYIDQKFLVRDNPLLKKPRHAIDAHNGKREVALEESEVKEYLAKIKNRDPSVCLLIARELPPLNRYGEEKITTWLYRDQAKEFGLGLKDFGIKENRPIQTDVFEHITKQKAPYANVLYQRGIPAQAFISANLGFLKDPTYIYGIERFQPNKR